MNFWRSYFKDPDLDTKRIYIARLFSGARDWNFGLFTQEIFTNEYKVIVKTRWFHIQTLTIKIKEEFIEKVFNHLPDDSDSLPIQMLRDSLKMVKRLSERNVGKIVADIFSNGSVKSIDRKELKRKLFYLDTTSLSI